MYVLKGFTLSLLPMRSCQNDACMAAARPSRAYCHSRSKNNSNKPTYFNLRKSCSVKPRKRDSAYPVQLSNASLTAGLLLPPPLPSVKYKNAALGLAICSDSGTKIFCQLLPAGTGLGGLPSGSDKARPNKGVGRGVSSAPRHRATMSRARTNSRCMTPTVLAVTMNAVLAASVQAATTSHHITTCLD